MPELLTLQDLANGHLDVVSLEKFINGSDSETVLTRLSAEYPTLQKAIKQMFENGGLPADRFKVLSDLQSSDLPDGSYAFVSDDTTDKNGIYIREKDAWVKSKYDAEFLKASNIKNYATDNINLFPNPEFIVRSGVSQSSSSVVNGTYGKELVLKSGKVSYFFTSEPMPLYFREGDEVKLSVEAKGVTDPNASDAESYDISFQFERLGGSKITKGTPTKSGQKTGEWERLELVAAIPEGTTAITYRFTSRSGTVEDTVFRDVKLTNLTNPQTINLPLLRKELGDMQSSFERLEYSSLGFELFPNPDLTSIGSKYFMGTTSIEGGAPVHSLDTGGGVKYTYYTINIDDGAFRVGDELSFSVQAYSDAIDGLDISIEFLDSSAARISASPQSSVSKTNTWQTITTSSVVPSGAISAYLRMITRGGSQVAKIRSPKLSTSNPNITKLPISILNSRHSSGDTVVYVSASSGSDSSNGLTVQSAVKTLSTALSLLPSSGGDVVVVDSSDFRETLSISNKGHVTIKPLANNSINIFGSDKLVLSKLAGYDNIYSVNCPSKPVAMGGNRGKPTIFEWGTPSKPIPDEERHFLQHGMAHRLPFTEMFEVDISSLGASPSKDTILQYLDSRLGEWYWEDGVIYLCSVEGGDASSKRYEHRVRPVLTHTSGTIELTRVNSWFSASTGFQFSGLRTVRYGCKVFGAHADGFSDDASFTVSYKDEAAACGNDGFNGTITNPSAMPDSDYRLEAVYFDPYGHDNYDDGISFHYKGDATVYGGVFEYNNKADVVHVTGANCVCYNTVVRGATHGFYTATDPVDDSERAVTVLKCVNTVSINNEFSYRAANNSILHCHGAKAINPTTMGYYQSGAGYIHTTDCKFSGSSDKMKVGNVIVANTVLVE